MAMTKIHLMQVPLENDYKHTLYFAGSTPAEKRQKQYEYFYSKRQVSYTDFTYQRKDEKIRVNAQYDSIINCNYCMYQNTAYNNKWFYAFITDIKFISDGVTEIFIETDVMQTWLCDYALKQCFVEREHTNNDTRGANTIPESLETGEYICNNVIHDESTTPTCFIVASSVDLENPKQDSSIRVYNGVLNGWYYYHFDTAAEVREVLTDIATMRTNDSIISIFTMPKNYIHQLPGSDHKVLETWEIPKYTYWEGINKPTTVNGYTPKNNKLFTYPYSYLLVDNNAGAVSTYKYELFNEKCSFYITGCITPGGSMRLLPVNYNGVEGENHHFGLNGGKFPVCGWQSDYYTNWLTQNALNIEVQTESINLTAEQNQINDIANMVGSFVSLDFGSAAKSATDLYYNGKHADNQIKGIVAQKQMHRFQSPTVSGAVASGDINFCLGNSRFSAYQMSVKAEFARVIDDYFTMYGYQTNRVKVPNTNHRSRFWYTKTVGCELDGAMAQKDMQKIKACYDNGITFWRDAADIAIYNTANTIL